MTADVAGSPDDPLTALVRQLLDERAVRSVLLRYARALDTRDWDLLASCFTEDATTDYGALGGRNVGVDVIVATCRRALSPFDATHHLVGNIEVELDGAQARAHCYVQAQHRLDAAPGGGLHLVGGSYEDELVLAGGRWLIAHRVLRVSWAAGDRPASPVPPQQG